MSRTNLNSKEAGHIRATKMLESLSSYTITDISADQVNDFVELTELAGIPTSFEITKIILQMLSSGIEPEVVYQLCLNICNERKLLKRSKKEKR